MNKTLHYPLYLLLLTVLLFGAFVAYAEDTANNVASGGETVVEEIASPGVDVTPPVRGPVRTACPMVYAPVCGENGKIYGNSCLAKSYGIENFTKGPCANTDVSPRGLEPVKPRVGTSAEGKPATSSQGFLGNFRRDNTSTSDIKQKTRERAEERVKQQVKRFVSLVLAAIERMEHLMARIESRADKLDEAGMDTSSAREDLAAAKREIDAAKSDLQTIGDYSVSFLASRSLAAVATSLSPARSALQSAREHIHAAELYIRSAIKKLKEVTASNDSPLQEETE